MKSDANASKHKYISDHKYLPGLLTETKPFTYGLATLLQEIADLKFPKDLKETKFINLITPKKGVDSCDSKTHAWFCDWANSRKYKADFLTNVLGSTRVINAGTDTKLDTCETNGVIGLLHSEKALEIEIGKDKDA